jgi:hypothetical protein
MDLYPLLWLIWILLGLTLETFALISQVPGRTLSELVWFIAHDYPLLPLAFGALMGHWFWQRRS